MMLYIVFWMLPALAVAQMDEFQQVFIQTNQRYLSEKNIMVAQHYLFSLDSVTATPIDSGYCYIEKNDKVMHYRFNGVESFNDGTYLIRINNPDRYMIVSQSNKADSSAPEFLFKEGFSGFKNAEKKSISVELSLWKLTGGTYGVPEVSITIDTREARIWNVISELSPDNPYVIQINANRSKTPHKVFVRIDYAYTTEVSKEKPQFSDYIHVENDVVTPAEKFKDYQIKFIK
ncbi:MAG: hypothetical protein M0P61_04715 [Ignavibacteriaceae bacterium]|nr:hypothetical protein [Ignavibacteriaceae bacterium]